MCTTPPNVPGSAGQPHRSPAAGPCPVSRAQRGLCVRSAPLLGAHQQMVPCVKFSDHEERLSGSDREEDEDDVEAALKKEVGQIRASTEQKLRRFQSVESGANNVVFIRTQGIGGISADIE